MGGPGVSAFSCIQYITEAADIVRGIKRDSSSTLDPELKAKIVDILDQLAEAKVAAVEAGQEIRYISNHAEDQERELEFVSGLLARAQQSPAPTTAALSQEDLNVEQERAEHLVRMASFAAADQGFKSLDTFATWFVGGTAAALALMAANFEKVEPFVAGLDLQAALVKIVIALGLVGVAKFFGSLLTTLARGSERILEVVDHWERRGWPLPSGEALQAAQHAALPALFRLLPKTLIERSHQPVIQARQIVTFLMVAGLSTLAAVTLVIVTLVEIAMLL